MANSRLAGALKIIRRSRVSRFSWRCLNRNAAHCRDRTSDFRMPWPAVGRCGLRQPANFHPPFMDGWESWQAEECGKQGSGSLGPAARGFQPRVAAGDALRSAGRLGICEHAAQRKATSRRQHAGRRLSPSGCAEGGRTQGRRKDTFRVPQPASQLGEFPRAERN
jgi:hypothetical protein